MKSQGELVKKGATNKTNTADDEESNNINYEAEIPNYPLLYKESRQNELLLNNEVDGYAILKEQWNGESVLDKIPKWHAKDFFVVQRIKHVLSSLNYSKESAQMWEGGMLGLFLATQRIIKKFVQNAVFDGFMMLCVFLNTIVLSLDGLVDKEGESLLATFNFIFTIIFTIDMSLKILGLGIKEYIKDRMNIFDAVIVILSLIELAIFGTGSGSAISAFRSVRIFRTFRVLRVTRLIRSLEYMRVIMRVVGNTLTSFIYIFILLILFNYIYALLGMQFFGGKFNYEDKIRQNFDTFGNAFQTVFQVMTMENWNDILVATLRTSVNKGLSLLYFISWIFIGNYVLLNLFLAILLEGFDSEEIGEEVQENQQEETKANQNSTNGNGSGLNTSAMMQNSGSSTKNIQRQSTQNNEQKSPSSISNIRVQDLYDEEDELEEENANQRNSKRKSSGIVYGTLSSQNNNNMEDSQASSMQNWLLNKQQQKKKAEKNQFVYFQNIECQKVFYLISQENIFRKFCYFVVKHKFFEPVILSAIILR